MYFEKKIKFNTYIGTDEVGRGSLAGPVVSSAVYIQKGDIGKVKGVCDSKKISDKKRRELYRELVGAHKYSTSFISCREVDKINIHNASLKAMRSAVIGLKLKSEILIIDGSFTVPGLKHNQRAFTKADQRFYSVAAASIIAKVERDDYMIKIGEKYPNYFFEKHKGYGTKQHKESIRKFGTLEIHRKSFNLS